MRIQWGSTGGADPAAAVQPTNARGTIPFRAATRVAEDWTALGAHRKSQRLAGEVGSANFTFSAPVAHYPGRGDLSLRLDLVYNSRVWQRVGPITARKWVFDIDEDWPAPGWSLHLGQLVSLGFGAAMVVEPDGTRRPFKVDRFNDAGSNAAYLSAHTIDGSHIVYQAEWHYRGGNRAGPYLAQGRLIRTDGTHIEFGHSTHNKVHATRLTDRNGNTMAVEYDPASKKMVRITDTCGRVIKFSYREDAMTGEMLLNKVVGPAPNRSWESVQTDTDLVVVNLSSRQLATSFQDPVHEQPARAGIISGLYYPATHTGYWLPASSYSTYGMLKRVQACRGMSLGPPTPNGPQIVTGPVTWERAYNFPDRPGPVQKDVPTYTTLSETWTGRTDPPLVTTFSVQRTATAVRTEITWPDKAKTVQETTLGSASEPAGLLKELRIVDPWGKELQRTHVHSWHIAPDGTPQLMDVHVIDEAGHLAKTTFAYGATSTQPTLVDQWEYTLTPTPAKRILRRTETEYVNSDAYLSRNLRNLPETVRVYEPFDPYGSNILRAASVTQYLYDTTPRLPAPGIVGFDPSFVAGSPQYVQTTTCRGNPTVIHRYGDAASMREPISEMRSYDICGNLVAVDAGPGRVQHEHRAESRYLTPAVTWLTGTAAGSPRMALFHVVTSTCTGQPLHLTDANGQAWHSEYDAAGRLTLRSSATTNSEARVARDDAALSQTVTTKGGGPGSAWLANSTTTTFDGRGRTKSVRTQRSDGDVVVNYSYDPRGRLTAISAPHHDGEVPTWDYIDVDVLGRPTGRLDLNRSTTSWYYNEPARPGNRTDHSDEAFPTVRIVGGNGVERWMSFDGLQRLKEIVTPAPDGPGTVIPSGGFCTNYGYDGLNNTTNIDLHAAGNVQQRRFRYDSLGRLVRQYLPEAGDGITETHAGVTERWSAAFDYDERSNLVRREDSRGVVVGFDYNDALGRLQHITYSTSGFRDHDHPVVECPDVSYTYETTGDLRRIHQERCAGVSTQIYGYDPVFGLTSVTLTMDSAPQHPFTLDYGHDQLGRPTTTTYPAQYGDGPGTHRPTLGLQYRLGGLPDHLSVVGFGDLARTFEYTTAGQIDSVLIGPDGVEESYAHEQPNPALLTGQSVTHNNDTLLNIAYQYYAPSTATGAAPQVKTAEDLLDPNGTRQASYDKLNRLRAYDGGPGPAGVWGEEYDYDLHGNRTTVTVHGDIAPSTPAASDGEPQLTYDDANHITNAGYDYDAAGNLVAARIGGVDYRYQYDASGRLVWVHNTVTDATTGYVFGAGPRRRATIQITPTSWPPPTSPAATPANQITSATFDIWDADRVVASYNASGPDLEATLHWQELSFYLDQRLISTWEITQNLTPRITYHHPGLTGTLLITGPSPGGQPLELAANENLPFGGALLHDAGTSRPFTSYTRDTTTGLDYAINRFYQPALGRFLQPDPAGVVAFNPAEPGSLNSYPYCGNDPLNRTDPLGLAWKTACVQAGDNPPVCSDFWTPDPQDLIPMGRTIRSGDGGASYQGPVITADTRTAQERASDKERTEEIETLIRKYPWFDPTDAGSQIFLEATLFSQRGRSFYALLKAGVNTAVRALSPVEVELVEPVP